MLDEVVDDVVGRGVVAAHAAFLLIGCSADEPLPRQHRAQPARVGRRYRRRLRTSQNGPVRARARRRRWPPPGPCAGGSRRAAGRRYQVLPSRHIVARSTSAPTRSPSAVVHCSTCSGPQASRTVEQVRTTSSYQRAAGTRKWATYGSDGGTRSASRASGRPQPRQVVAATSTCWSSAAMIPNESQAQPPHHFCSAEDTKCICRAEKDGPSGPQPGPRPGPARARRAAAPSRPDLLDAERRRAPGRGRGTALFHELPVDDLACPRRRWASSPPRSPSLCRIGTKSTLVGTREPGSPG